jgi:hypothetical protein
MRRQHLSYPVLYSAPISQGAATPVPKETGTLAWSSTELDLMSWNGNTWEFAGYRNEPPVYGIGDFAAASFLNNTAPGSEPGVTSGFGFAFLTQPPRSGSSQIPIHNIALDQTPVGTKGGYMLRVLSGNLWQFLVYTNDTNQGWSALAGYTMQPHDYDKIMLIVCHFDGTNIRLWVDRKQQGTNHPITGTYLPATQDFRIGAWSGQYYQGLFLGFATFRGNPSDAQFTAFFDAARALGDIPPTIQGATLGHRWSARETLLGQTIKPGQTAPRAFIDTVTGKASDALTASTNNLTISRIDTEKYGKALYGAQGFATQMRMETAPGKGIRGAATGFWVAVAGLISNDGSANTWTCCAPTGTFNGWSFIRNSSGNLYASIGLGLGLMIEAIPVRNIPLLACIVWNGSAMQYYVDGKLMGTGGFPGYIPAASDISMQIGNQAPFTAPNISDEIYGVVGGDAIPTLAEIKKNAADFQRTGRIQPIPGKTDHIYDLHQAVIDNPLSKWTYPITLNDAIGSIPIRRLADGRYSTEANSTLDNPFVGGSTCWYAWYGQINEFRNAGIAILMGTVDILTMGGWYLGASSGNFNNISFRAHFSTSQSYTFKLSDAGRPLLFVCVRNGSTMRLYLDGVQVGTDLVSAYPHVSAAGSTPFTVLGAPSDSGPAINCTLLGVAGSDTATLTPAEVTALYISVIVTGRIQPVAGKTAHLYDAQPTAVLHQEKQFSPVVRDLIGSDNVENIEDPWAIKVLSKSKGVTGFNAGRFYITRRGQGLPGNVDGFWAAVVFESTGVVNWPRVPFSHWNISNLGWAFRISSGVTNNYVSAYMADGNGGFIGIGNNTHDVNTQGLTHLALVYDGITAYLYANGVLLTSATVSPFVPFTGTGAATCIGSSGNNVTYAANKMVIYGAGGGDFIPSAAEIATAAQASLLAQRFVEIPGQTDKYWNLSEDVDEAGGLPIVAKERKGSNELMVRRGSNIQVMVRKEQLWNYETRPIMYGIKNFTAANYLGTANNACAGALYGFFITIAYLFQSPASTNVVRTLVATRGAALGYGYSIQSSGQPGGVSGTIGFDSGANAGSPTYTITNPAQMNKIHLSTLMYDPINARVYMYHDRLGTSSSGTSVTTSINYRANPDVALRVGVRNDLTLPAIDTTIIGVAYGAGHLTPHEHNSMYAQMIAAECLVKAPKMANLWDFSSTIKANRGTLPATFYDQINGVALGVTGALASEPLYVRGFAG